MSQNLYCIFACRNDNQKDYWLSLVLFLYFIFISKVILCLYTCIFNKIQYLISISFYIFIRNKMPVFADALPQVDVLPLDSFDPSSLSDLSSLWFGSMMSPMMIIISCVFTIYWIVCLWRIFKKAWLPWRGSIIPIYNIILWFKMAWRSWRRTLSLLCPPLFAIMWIVTYFDIAKRFGKGVWFWFGLWFLYPIFIWILAFGKAEYIGENN